jgi:endonuclease III
VAKLHKALRAAYKPVAPKTSDDLLKQTLFACCLEDAPAELAERAFARLMERSFDLNEVRVTTVAELAEAIHDLPDPSRAALSLRRVLQGVFESTYSFSLEHARKHSLAHGLKTLEHLHGISPFVVHYVASTALGGHFIPLDRGALSGLFLCGIVSQQEYDAGKVAGLERFVPKKAGVEFASLLHQFGVDCLTNLHGATVKKVVAAVNPAAKDRFPKRGEPLPAPVPPPPAAGKEGQRAAEAARQAAELHRPAGPQAAARPAGKTPLPPPGSGPKRSGDGKTAGGKPGPKPFVVKPNMGKPITIKPQPAPPPAAEKPPAKPKPAAARPAKIQPRGAAAAKKAGASAAASRQLSKRKPR